MPPSSATTQVATPADTADEPKAVGEADAAGTRRTTVDLGHGPEDVVLVDWAPRDPQNPFNWSSPRKAATLAVALFISFLSTVMASSVGIMAHWGPEWFRTSHTGYMLSITTYLLAIAFTPLVLAPTSEMFGRNAIYQVTSVISALLFIPQALSHSLPGLLAARFFQGMVCSVGNSMVGGTVADMYAAKHRGVAMNIFSLAMFAGQAGGAIFGWVGMRAGIQWCYGIQGLWAALSCVLNALVLRETRGDVLLSRRARRLTKQTGVKHLAAPDLRPRNMWSLVSQSATRPLQYLFTEPIVAAVSLWIGFAWATIWLGTSSTLLVFGQYGWDPAWQGMALLINLVGGVLGFASNFHQEWLYQRARRKHGGRAPPEARLYWGAYGGLIFPLGMFIFAWTGQPQFHWAIPATFLALSMWGVYAMYSAVFTYLADAYETYSSSAQAAQSFVRNIFSGLFPLFARTMYERMGYPKASTTVASIGTVLAAAPILLIVYGARLRARSKVASALAKDSA
ncbi:hypothetical protein Q8F55_001870 [Vanrija albida]|uniref:Major facilitator superfamily (MFS) profile domain-containing protein n=1 Tax=Vanrija albida TaxID=181172 RepID=A0ABR3Q8U7_9TREE